MSAKPDVIDQHLDKLLSFHYEDRRRLFDRSDEVEESFASMQRLLLGKNTTQTLIDVRLAMSKGGQMPALDLNGWQVGNEAFFSETRKVDRAMSLLVDIYLHMIKVLSKADEAKNIQVQAAPVTNAQGFVTEKRGFLDGFRSFVDSLKPKWKQDYEHGMSIVSSLFDDFNNARVKWEEYKSQHWQNISKAVEYSPEEFGAVMLDELEALDDVAMRVMRMLDAGMRLLQMEQSSQLTSLANVMVSNKTAQLQQASMMAPASFPGSGGGGMQGLPNASNGH